MLHVAREASQQNVSANGRYGSKALFCLAASHFRSTPINGHCQTASPCLKGAMKGHLNSFDHLVGAN